MVSAIRPAKTCGKDKEAFGFAGFQNLFWCLLHHLRTFTLYNMSLHFTRFFPDLIQRKTVKKRNDKEPVNNLKQRKSDYFDKCFAAL